MASGQSIVRWSDEALERLRGRFLAWGSDRNVFYPIGLGGPGGIAIASPKLEATFLAYKLLMVVIASERRTSVDAVKPQLQLKVRRAYVEWAKELHDSIGALVVKRMGQPVPDGPPDVDFNQQVAELMRARLDEADENVRAVVSSLQRNQPQPLKPLYQNLRAVTGGKSPAHEEEMLFGPIVTELYDMLRAELPRAQNSSTLWAWIIFIAVLAAATILGGFVGAELLGSAFSATGAVVGFIATAAVLLGLGASFDAQARRRARALPPEVRQAFDRMVTGQSNPTAAQIDAAKRRLRR